MTPTSEATGSDATREWSPILRGSDAVIPLTQGEFAVVDAGDLHLVLGRAWQVYRSRRTMYAESNGRVKMHRLIMGFGPDDPEVDHIDGNGLNNRRSNLRPASRSQNLSNQRPRVGCSSRFKGVSWHAGRWRSSITVGGKQVNLGRFDDEVEAARAYDAAAVAARGEFAWLNFP